MEFVTPESYAAHLATYIASPTKIEALVAVEFDHPPPLHKIAEMRFRVEQADRRARTPIHSRDSAANDGVHWQPVSFIRRPKPEPRRYKNSRTAYVPAHIELPRQTGPLPVIRCHTDVIRAVAQAFGLTYSEVVGKVRTAKYVAARAVAAKILVERGNALADTGRFMDRDHTTILNLIDNFEERCKRFPEMRDVYELLTTPQAEAA